MNRWAPPAPPAPPERDHCGSCCSRSTLLTSNPRKSSRFGGAGGAVVLVASRPCLMRHRSATEAPPKKGLGCFRWRSTVSVVYRCTLTAVCCRVWRVVVRHRRGCLRHRRGSAPPGFGGASVAHQGPTETVLRSGRLGPGCPMLVGAVARVVWVSGLPAGVLACVPWPGHGSYNHH